MTDTGTRCQLITLVLRLKSAMAGENILNDDDYDLEIEYSSSGESEKEVELENQYYRGKNAKAENLQVALYAFEKVIKLEGNNYSRWGFKALKQILEINFELKMYNKTLNDYKEMLKYYFDSIITKNQFEKSVNSISKLITSSNNLDLVQEFHEVTLEALRVSSNNSLWFNTNLRLAMVFKKKEMYWKMFNILKTLKKGCKNDSGDFVLEKHPQLLEVYAFKLEVYTEQNDITKMNKVYQRILTLSSVKPYSKTLIIIKECGGKIDLLFGRYEQAYNNFFVALHIHDDHSKRITCLKYLILSSMLMDGPCNPMISGKDNTRPEAIPMNELINVYSTNDNQFEEILNKKKNQLLEDPSVHGPVQKLPEMIQTHTLLNILLPHTEIKLSCVAHQMNMTVDETEDVLVKNILNQIIEAKIDQVDEVVLIRKTPPLVAESELEKNKIRAYLTLNIIKNVIKILK